MLMMSGYANAEQPGTRFAYNDQAISLFIAALRQRVGYNLTSAIKGYFPELNLTSSGIILSTGRSSASLYDFAKLLQLLLNEGNWQGKQLIRKTILNDAFGTLASGPMSSSASERNGYTWILPIWGVAQTRPGKRGRVRASMCLMAG